MLGYVWHIMMTNNYVNGVYKDEWKVLIKMNTHNEIWAETGRVIFNFRMSIYKMALTLRHVLIILLLYK